MFGSNYFEKTEITINGKHCKMEYDLNSLNKTSLRCFGNIYIEMDEPMEFTFFTINNKIAGYIPMNGTKEFIGSIVFAALGRELPFEE